jgi:phage protein U
MSATFEGNGMKLQQADESNDPNDLLLTGFVFPDQPALTIPALVFKKTKDAVQDLALSALAPQSAATIPYNLTTSATAGQGMFALEDIKIGALILTERPILVTRAVSESMEYI